MSNEQPSSETLTAPPAAQRTETAEVAVDAAPAGAAGPGKPADNAKNPEPFWSRPFSRHVALIAVLGAFFLLLAFTYPIQARHIADDWVKHLEPPASAKLEAFSVCQSTPEERERLKDQLHLARNRAAHHLSVTIYFFSNYYMSLLVTFVAGAFAAVSLFFIAKSGYQTVSPYVLTIFVASSAFATAFGAFPGVFRQADNVSENKVLYLRYVALQNEMLSYSATAKDINAKPLSPSEFIAYVDSELNKVNNLAVGFDATKIPVFKFESK